MMMIDDDDDGMMIDECMMMMQSQEPTSLWMDTKYLHLWNLNVDDHESF